MSRKKVVTLDVREDIRRGREPFSRIMQTVSTLKENEDLLLIAPFEPAPLFGMLAQQGFSHESKETGSGDWEVRFSRKSGDQIQNDPSPDQDMSSKASKRDAGGGTPAVDVDARGLEPPQPLVKILEALSTLPKGTCMRAHTDRRPMHLYDQLAERGFTGESEEQKDGSFITYVRRR